MGFDARSAKLLQPGQHIVVDDYPGLRLVASTKGRAWIYRYQVGDKTRQIKFGQWPAMSLGNAITRWQELKDERAGGVDPALERKAARKKKLIYTVAQVVQAYIDGHLVANRKPDGAKATAARLRTAIEPIAHMDAAEVSRAVAFDLISGLAQTPVVAKSVKNELGAAWDLALDSGALAETPNWWRQILAGKLKSKGAVRDGVHKGTAKRTLSDAEISTLFDVDMGRFSQQVQDFLIVQLWTCTRGGEIVQMHGRQITREHDGWWWTVPKELTKGARNPNASDLRVPLVGRALAVVQRLGGGALFPSVSRLGVVGVQKQTYMQTKVHYLQPYCKTRPDHIRERLTVTHWSPHDLRRTGRTGLSAMGCPTDVAEAILGHVQPGIQGVYNAHKYDAERRHWLARWSALLELLIAPAVCNQQIA
jgi:integrase